MKSQKQVASERIGYHANLYAQWATAKGHCTETVAKARELALAGAVLPTANPDVFTVKSSRLDESYIVNGACPCTGAKHAYKGRCSHRVAVALYRAVQKDLTAMQDNPAIPHEHTYSCGHGSFHCWEHPCKEIRDPQDFLCDACESAAIFAGLEPVGAEMLNQTTGELTPVGETLEQLLESLGPPDDAPLHTEQYEPRPVLPPAPAPLPEAPASLNLKIKLPGGHEMMYTLRGHDDAIIARVPNILKQLEAVIQPATDAPEAGWLHRISQACLPLSWRNRSNGSHGNGDL